MDLNQKQKKQIGLTIIALVFIIFILLPILLPPTQQKQNQPPQNLTQNPTAMTDQNANPRINEIVKLATEKKIAYRKLEELTAELQRATDINCVFTNEGCQKLLTQLAVDAEIVNALKTIHQENGITIFIYPEIGQASEKIYINDYGYLIIRATIPLIEIKTFLGLRPKK